MKNILSTDSLLSSVSMLDARNSINNVIHFKIPKPVVMKIAEQVNKSGQAGSNLMQLSLEPSESSPRSVNH